MGTWSRKLYGNDYACDIKDDCVLFLSYFQNGQKAYEKLLEKYEKEFDDEEPLFWYAVADTMLKYGVLIPEVKEMAGNASGVKDRFDWRTSGTEKDTEI